LREFPDVIMGYGQSDEYSFVLHKSTALFGARRQEMMMVVEAVHTSPPTLPLQL
jgi:tRNA(His) guanylyltransferase